MTVNKHCDFINYVLYPLMGTFAETAIDYRLSFADQGKLTSVFCFCLQQSNGNCRFLLVLFPYIYVSICIHIDGKRN
jgi:hypothetical protein